MRAALGVPLTAALTVTIAREHAPDCRVQYRAADGVDGACWREVAERADDGWRPVGREPVDGLRVGGAAREKMGSA